MFEMFVSILPVHSDQEKLQGAKYFAGIDPEKVLDALQHDLFSQLYFDKKFDTMESYLMFLREGINYVLGDTKLMPEMNTDALKYFENRLYVIQKDLEKLEKKKDV